MISTKTKTDDNKKHGCSNHDFWGLGRSRLLDSSFFFWTHASLYVTQLPLFFFAQEEHIEEIARDIEAFNLNKEVRQYIQDYAVIELLGAGAFGSVYKVKKKNGQSHLAMKEVNTMGHTVVVVTHENDIANLCDRVVHLKDGVIERDDKVVHP